VPERVPSVDFSCDLLEAVQTKTVSVHKNVAMTPRSLSPRLRFHVKAYAQSHSTPVNKALHFLGIPLFLVAIFGLLSKLPPQETFSVPAFAPNAGWILFLGAAVWYLYQDWKTGLATLVVMAGCSIVGSLLSIWILIGFLAGGVASHWIGHFFFERKPPLIFSRPVAVLEAPAWLISIALGFYR
jgi:uncharacterized membrane protein YGL010W